MGTFCVDAYGYALYPYINTARETPMPSTFPPMPADLKADEIYWTVLHPNWLACLSDEQRARHAGDPELAERYSASILAQLNEARGKSQGAAGWSAMQREVPIPHGPTVFEAIARGLDDRRAAQMAVAA